MVIFATGIRTALPQFFPPLMSRIAMRDGAISKYATTWPWSEDSPKENNVFAVDASMQTHGIAKPQLSLMAWRCARILNRVMGRDLFDLGVPPALIQWRSGTWENAAGGCFNSLHSIFGLIFPPCGGIMMISKKYTLWALDHCFYHDGASSRSTNR